MSACPECGSDRSCPGRGTDTAAVAPALSVVRELEQHPGRELLFGALDRARALIERTDALSVSIAILTRDGAPIALLADRGNVPVTQILGSILTLLHDRMTVLDEREAPK